MRCLLLGMVVSATVPERVGAVPFMLRTVTVDTALPVQEGWMSVDVWAYSPHFRLEVSFSAVVPLEAPRDVLQQCLREALEAALRTRYG